jgi:hypothetical protein
VRASAAVQRNREIQRAYLQRKKARTRAPVQAPHVCQRTRSFPSSMAPCIVCILPQALRLPPGASARMHAGVTRSDPCVA